METKDLNLLAKNLELMSTNSVLEFIIKMNSINLEDRFILMNYYEITNNNIKICENLGLIEKKDELKKIKSKIINQMNDITEKLI